MGRTKQISVTDSRGFLWRGARRPDLEVLGPIFSRVIDLDPTVLARDPQSAWAVVEPRTSDWAAVLVGHRLVFRVDASPVQRIAVACLGPPDRRWQHLIPGKRRSSGHEAHLAAHRLRALGVAAVRPLGYVERVDASYRYPSFAAFEWIDGPSALAVWQRPDVAHLRRALLLQVATFVRGLHAAGVHVPGLGPQHLWLTSDGVFLAEPEAVAGFRIDQRAVEENLATLSAGVPGLSNTDRMRFLYEYARYQADRREVVRALWSGAVAGLSRVFRGGGKSSGDL